MSVQDLTNAAVADLREQRETYVERLATRHTASLDEMRFNQGVIQGINMAMAVIAERANNLHG